MARYENLVAPRISDPEDESFPRAEGPPSAPFPKRRRQPPLRLLQRPGMKYMRPTGRLLRVLVCNYLTRVPVSEHGRSSASLLWSHMDAPLGAA